MAGVEVQKIKSQGHNIFIGSHALAELSETLSSDSFAQVKLFILVDDNTLNNCLPKLIDKVPLLKSAEVIEVENGESSKSIDVCSQIWSALGELHADRQSVIFNLGGGVVTDLGGFIAGTFKRGIRFFNIPTSLLAQVDASVGSKVGVNLNGLKNEIGLFYTPQEVYIDPAFLDTLPRNHLLSGFAEMVKHALIFDRTYWSLIKAVSFYEMQTLYEALNRSIEIKNEIVTSDPYESGRRKILNFGHTVGHALESYSMEGDGRVLLHGEAIAAGIISEAYISSQITDLSEEELNEITSFIFSLFPKVQLSEMAYHRIIEIMRHDKKNKNDLICMSLINSIGDSNYDFEVPPSLVIESLNYYQRWVKK